jgi:protocatechuate 3,4-dioxygenase beta subunit
MCLVALGLSTPDARAQTIVVNGSPVDSIQRPGPPRESARQFKTGTARIRGRIVAADTGVPLRRAQVRISGGEIQPKGAVTDNEGRYEFRDLPGGRFSLSAAKPGYVMVQYGQTRPYESGKPLDLADGQVFDRADIAMPKGSVISGRILDEFGEPIADAMVSAVRSAWSGGRRRLMPTGRTAQTNDLGQFRIYGLAPGEYYVSATVRGGDPMMSEMAMAPDGVISPGPTGSNPRSGFAPTYFPGTANGAEAQKIPLAPGQEAQTTDFALLPVRLARISGMVISSEGKPVEGAMINAVPRGAEGAAVLMGMGMSSRTDRNGNFMLTNVAPGDYTLQARGGSITTPGDSGSIVFTARVAGRPIGSDAEAGSVPITIGAEDLSNVVIATARGGTATGEVMFEGGAVPANMTGMQLIARPVENDGPILFSNGGPGPVNADRTFELRGLAGLLAIRPVNIPPGWMLKSVRIDGTDVTDRGIDFKPGAAVTGIHVILTAKVTRVSGMVKNSTGELASDYTVVVFSDEPQRWTLPNSRYVTGRRADRDGRFQIEGLPPGGYYAAALEYLPQGEWGDPDLLDRLKTKATQFSLDEGESKTIEVRMQ